MTADTITAIKKGLEGVTVQEWTFDGPADNIIIWCGTDTRVCFMTSDGPAKEHAQFITACQPAAITELLSTLESLQRENAELREDRYDLAYAITGGEDAPGLLDSVPTSQLVEIARGTHRSHSADIDRASAAEAKVNRLRDNISYYRSGSFAHAVNEHLADAGISINGDILHDCIQRSALASTGGEHHAE